MRNLEVLKEDVVYEVEITHEEVDEWAQVGTYFDGDKAISFAKKLLQRQVSGSWGVRVVECTEMDEEVWKDVP